MGGKKYFSVESYYRLVIPEVFQAYSKVIYMDCDMVVTTDIGRLYDTDLDGYMLASVPDYCLYGQYCAGWPIKQYWDNQLKLSCPEEYFCAGMVIFNISEWRKQYNIEQIIDLALSREWQKHDQDILNWVCAQKTKMLDLSWDIVRDYGIIKEDMSATYNRFNNNISLFVTAANPEYKSICENPRYGFGEDITKLTGCPRHDYLYHSEKKIITIMPTWRRYLFQHSEIPGVWEPRKEFIHSEYFSFYNGLINHSRLLKVAQAKGYTIRFMPHPNVQGALHLFAHNDTVQFLGLDSRYRNVFADSALVITDRSSAVMDFAYLRKPIIYCLFDDDTFMTGEHVYVKGYFDYERDGFGEVEYDLESTVDRIIEYMENGCQLKDKYRKRIDKFFAFNDHNNCQRVYEKIMELDKQE